MAKHVISTLGADTRYTKWMNQGGPHTALRSVLVKGGAGIVSPLSFVRGSVRAAPEGVSTEVSNEDAEFLAAHDQFKEHQKRGFVKIINMDKNPDSVAQSMEKDEGSRPRNAGDVKKYSEDLKKKLGKSDPAADLKVTTN